VKMAAAKIKEGAHSLAGFIAELKQARLAAKLGELTQRSWRRRSRHGRTPSGSRSQQSRQWTS